MDGDEPHSVPASSHGGNGGIGDPKHSLLGGVKSLSEEIIHKVAHTPRGGDSKGASESINAGKGRREIVRWSAFEEFVDPSGCDRVWCLLIAYETGFQVFDVSRIERIGEAVELLSIRDQQVDRLHFLNPSCNVSASSPLYGRLPALALGVTLSRSPLPRSEIRIFSWQSIDIIHTISLQVELVNMWTNGHVIVVDSPRQILFFSSTTFELVRTLDCFPHSAPSSPVAVGSRLVAYAGLVPLPQALEPVATVSDYAADALALSRKFASNAVDYGRKAVVDIVTPRDIQDEVERRRAEAAPAPDSLEQLLLDSVNDERAGTVFVQECVTFGTIAHFRAHRHPISAMAFDTSGVLLATASHDGHNVNVFRILVSRSHLQNPLHLYRLRRGFTSAKILGLTFSADSLWLSAVSQRGTVHVFSLAPSSQVGQKLGSAPVEAQHGVAARIHLDGQEEENEKDQCGPYACPAVFFALQRFAVGEQRPHPLVSVCDSRGFLTEHLLDGSHIRSEEGSGVLTSIKCEGSRVWDVARRMSWPVYKRAWTEPDKAAKKRPANPFEMVDVSTSLSESPVWTLNQFVFLAATKTPTDDFWQLEPGVFSSSFPSSPEEFATLELRRSEPIPLTSTAESLAPMVLGFLSPAAPLVSEEDIRVSVEEAMRTRVKYLVEDYPALGEKQDESQ